MMRYKYVVLTLVLLAGCIPASGSIHERYNKMQSVRLEADQAAEDVNQSRQLRLQVMAEMEAAMLRDEAAMHADFSGEVQRMLLDALNAAGVIFGILFISGLAYLVWRLWVGQQQRFLLGKIKLLDERTEVFLQTSAKISQRYYKAYTPNPRDTPWRK